MQENQRAGIPRNTRHRFLLTCLALILGASSASGQTRPENPYYARVNSFGVFTAYSNNSSHILLGDAENRKLLDIGVSYSRRLILNRKVNWQFNAELLPVAVEGDPLSRIVNHQTSPTDETGTFDDGPLVSCAPVTTSWSYKDSKGVTHTGTTSFFCHGRQWTIGEGISPFGFQLNFLPRRALQPVVIGHGGYLYSTHPIPLAYAGSFNFTFDLGLGVELYRSKTRSVRAEYRYHHISNDNSAQSNPGIDNGLLQITYSFGR